MNTENGCEVIDLAYDVYDGTDELIPPSSPIVIVHGVFDFKENWKEIAENIADKSVKKVFVIDLRNHGDSGRSPDFSYSAMYRDLENFIRKLNEPVILIGHSLGSTVTMGFAMKEPNLIEKLISVDISPRDYPMNTETKILGALIQARESLQSIPSDYSLDEAKKFLKEDFEKNNIIPVVRQIFLSTLMKKKNGFQFKTNLEAVEEYICNKKTIRKTYPLSGFYKGSALIVHGGMSDYVSSLLRLCLIYINRHLQDILIYYENQNIDPTTLFSGFPPTLCELLLNFAPSDLDPEILSNFFRKGIKALRLPFYNNDLPIHRFSEVLNRIILARLSFSNITENNLSQIISLIPNISVLSLCGTNATNSTIEVIGRTCIFIESLDLSYCNITDDGLRCLCHDFDNREKRCKYLKVLKVKGTVVTSVGLVYILEHIPLFKLNVERNIFMKMVCRYVQNNYNKQLNLKELYLISGENVDFLEVLLSFPKIHSLCLYKVPIEETDAINVLSGFKWLRRLSISVEKNSKTLTFEGMISYLTEAGKQLSELKLNNFEYVNIYQIGINCVNLQVLSLYSIRHLYFKKDDNQISSIFDRLERINLENIRGTPWDDCFQCLFSNCPNLKDVIISSLSCLNDDLISEIIPLMKTVQSLAFHNCDNISKCSIYTILDKIPKLKSLWMIYNWNILSGNDQRQIKNYIMKNGIETRFHYWQMEGHFIPSDQISMTLEEMQF